MPRASTKPKRNPMAAGSSKPFARPDPDYPVKPWVLPQTREEVQTVCLQQDDGTYLAIILSDRTIRHTARTQQEAERGAVKKYRERRRNRAQDIEDEEDLRLIREREHGTFIPLQEVLKRHRRA